MGVRSLVDLLVVMWVCALLAGCAAVRVSEVSQTADPYDEFREEMARLLRGRSKKAAATANLSDLSDAEKEFERKVFQPLVDEAGFNTSVSFLKNKKDYDSSKLLELMQTMPKGGILHTHGIATGDFAALVELVQADGHFYVWKGEEGATAVGSIKSFANAAAAAAESESWKAASSIPKEELIKYLQLPADLTTVDACWEEFFKIWGRVGQLASVAPFYFGKGKFFWSMLETYNQNQVSYIEIKEVMFVPWTHYDGTKVSDDEMLTMFKQTVDTFKAENPGFLGARMVLTALKIQSNEEVQEAFKRGVVMKRNFPSYVAGFDMAGPEDTMNPLSYYAKTLMEEHAAAVRQGVHFPLLIHAGETIIPNATQIYDAVAMGFERIGHGFALAKHPRLMKRAIKKKIALECCPISNQVLGYFPNLAVHPAPQLLRSGVPMSISPDDPGMFGYSDVSYDFAAAVKAWDLNLMEVKALVKNSLLYSSMEANTKEEAVKDWEGHWKTWIESHVKEARRQRKEPSLYK